MRNQTLWISILLMLAGCYEMAAEKTSPTAIEIVLESPPEFTDCGRLGFHMEATSYNAATCDSEAFADAQECFNEGWKDCHPRYLTLRFIGEDSDTRYYYAIFVDNEQCRISLSKNSVDASTGETEPESWIYDTPNVPKLTCDNILADLMD